MAEDFKIYTAEHLRKINSMRRAASQPKSRSIPILTKPKLLYTTEAQLGGVPASCYGCDMYNYGRSCMKMGPSVVIRKFIYPSVATADAKRIEYWPCCGMQDPGQPNYGPAKYKEPFWNPTDVDLIWINAPEVGQEHGGANCGGKNGGDECDHYITENADSRTTESAFCRALQSEVENGDVCAGWDDDDKLEWTKAQALLKELDRDN